jgi:hypothetical protein
MLICSSVGKFVSSLLDLMGSYYCLHQLYEYIGMFCTSVHVCCRGISELLNVAWPWVICQQQIMQFLLSKN